jgi:hypothetical protein
MTHKLESKPVNAETGVVTLHASGTPQKSSLLDLLARKPEGLLAENLRPPVNSGVFAYYLCEGSIQVERPASDREVTQAAILTNYAGVSPALARVFELTVPPQAPTRTVFVPLA